MREDYYADKSHDQFQAAKERVEDGVPITDVLDDYPLVDEVDLRTMPGPNRVVIEDHGTWNWTLIVRDGEVLAVKAIPHEGQLIYSTEDKPNRAHKNSEFQLDVSEVVRRYVKKSRTHSAKDQLYAIAMDLVHDHTGCNSRCVDTDTDQHHATEAGDRGDSR